MARDSDEFERPAPPAILARPQISLIGEVSEAMVARFFDQLAAAEKAGGDIALEVTTQGGEAELARRLVLEIEQARKRLGVRFLFLGKTVVYSAGITIMSAFPCTDRWLMADAMLMIHGRKLEKTIELTGPIRTSLAEVEALCAQMKVGIALEEKGFERLIDGCSVTLDEIKAKALHNWYLTAEEALDRGLVAGIV